MKWRLLWSDRLQWTRESKQYVESSMIHEPVAKERSCRSSQGDRNGGCEYGYHPQTLMKVLHEQVRA